MRWRSIRSTPTSRSTSAGKFAERPVEDLVEKQNAEQGLNPVNRERARVLRILRREPPHDRCFLDGVMPRETWDAGFDVVRVLMACYQSAEIRTDRGLSTRRPGELRSAGGPGTWKP
jgi:hypothetical protein